MNSKDTSEQTVRDIRRKTRRKHSSEEKIRIGPELKKWVSYRPSQITDALQARQFKVKLGLSGKVFVEELHPINAAKLSKGWGPLLLNLFAYEPNIFYIWLMN